MVVAPLEDLAGVDVPGEVDEEVAGPTNVPRSEPMFFSVTRSRTKRTPFAVHFFSFSERSSKSITVTFPGGTLRCLKRIGSVHSATAP